MWATAMHNTVAPGAGR